MLMAKLMNVKWNQLISSLLVALVCLAIALAPTGPRLKMEAAPCAPPSRTPTGRLPIGTT